MKVMFFCC